MPLTSTKFLPRKLQQAFSRTSFGSGAETMKSLLAAIEANPAFITYFDDFLGTGAGTWPASQHWAYPATIGTGTESITVTTAAIGGELKVTSGSSTNDSAVQSLGLHWRGTEGWYYIARAKMASNASAKMELGMMDSITNDCAINAKATPTFTATDAACFIFDTTDDTNMTFITANAGVVGANADASNFTMDTSYHVYEIIGRGGVATGFIDGNFIGSGAITSTVALTPYVASLTRTGSAKTVQLDYMGTIGPRG